MQCAVTLHPAAVQDAEEALHWYAQRSERAAVRFIDELEDLIGAIAATPERFPVFHVGARRALFRRFPFYLVFRLSEARIEVLAVAHAKRRPGFWRDRS